MKTFFDDSAVSDRPVVCLTDNAMLAVPSIPTSPIRSSFVVQEEHNSNPSSDITAHYDLYIMLRAGLLLHVLLIGLSASNIDWQRFSFSLLENVFL